MARKLRIAIIGGGIGGLTAAAALRARGFEIDVTNARAHCRKSARDTDRPEWRARAYAMGLKPQLDAFACSTPKFVSMTFDTARYRIEGITVGNLHREIWRALSHHASRRSLWRSGSGRALRATCIRRKPVVGGADAWQCRRGALRRRQEIEADVIIGADGVRFAVRESLFGKDGAALYRARPAFARWCRWMSCPRASAPMASTCTSTMSAGSARRAM